MSAKTARLNLSEIGISSSSTTFTSKVSTPKIQNVIEIQVSPSVKMEKVKYIMDKAKQEVTVTLEDVPYTGSGVNTYKYAKYDQAEKWRTCFYSIDGRAPYNASKYVGPNEACPLSLSYTHYDFIYTVTIVYQDNTAPELTLNTSNNWVLTEEFRYTVLGKATDVDSGNAVTIKCKFNNGTEVNIGSGISDGINPISFSKDFICRGGRIYNGFTDVSGLLAEGTTHTLSVWAVDDQGGKSDVVTRTFTVKHNKAPILTVGTFPAVQSGLIPPDSITLSGTASDPDGNTITVKGKLNSGTEQTVLSGVASGNWLYSFKVSDLKAGANTVTITSTDQFGLSTVKTFNVNNAVTETPMKKSVARYKILAPKGSAREILAWLKREKGNLVVDAEASFVDKGLPEQYTAMTKESVDLTTSISEDELLGAVATAKSDVMFKLTLSRTNTSTNESAVMLVGVIS
ncbi:hypothetical protein [Brevibacillus laterosporus]|uniref:hypothetical protein n=1 Tax=Brevibacillus laterosporus TaxID=1465 RepID=UPI0015E24694|nr:hypothetical protein [Brevibacillus laterosporus]